MGRKGMTGKVWLATLLPTFIVACSTAEEPSNDIAETNSTSVQVGMPDNGASNESDRANSVSPPTPTDAPTPPANPSDTNLVFESSVTGGDDVEHRFTASEGQRITVTIDKSGNPYFNLIPPSGENWDALFVGMNEAEPTRWTGIAPATGEYRVLVYLRGNAKDTGQTRPYRIEAKVE